MKRFKGILWMAIGVILIGIFYIDQAPIVDAHTIDLIDKAHKINFDKYWSGFNINIYPVEIYKKNILKKDSIVRYYNDKFYEIKDKKPIYALSMDIDESGQAILLVTSARDFRSLSDVGNFNSSSADIYYQALIAHEAFHCFQADQGFYDVFSKEITIYEKSNALTTSRKLDENPEYQKLWMDEMKKLIDYAKEDNIQNYHAYLNSYQNRLDFLYNNFKEEDVIEYLKYSNLYEKAEGTAKYIENITLSMLSDKDLEFDIISYGKGTSKYYDSGFLKTYILNKKDDLDWKTDFFKTDKIFEDYLLVIDYQ